MAVGFFLLDFSPAKIKTSTKPKWSDNPYHLLGKNKKAYDHPDKFPKIYQKIRTGYDQEHPEYEVNYRMSALLEAR